MDRKAEQHLEQILSLARQSFSQVEATRQDISKDRAILKLRAQCGPRNVYVTEVLTSSTRWYSYYLLEGDHVVIGLDNFSDRPALRLKYGEAFTQHIDEPVPHLHHEDKRDLELTDEKFFPDFVQMVMRFEE